MSDTPDLIYKVAPVDAFAAAAQTGAFEGMPIDHQDGYIHFSTAAQLSKTLALHFAGQHDLMLVAVRTRDVSGDLKWEPSRGGDLFPHLYGVLPLSAVEWSAPISVFRDGTSRLPEAVR